MYGAYIFLYVAPAQYFGDACAQLESREKILEIIWHRTQASTVKKKVNL
jgi:hypothetical protein